VSVSDALVSMAHSNVIVTRGSSSSSSSDCNDLITTVEASFLRQSQNFELIQASMLRQNQHMEMLQSYATQLGTVINRLSNDQSIIRNEQSSMRAEMIERFATLESTQNPLTTLINTSEVLRSAFFFLMSVGMDSRFGLICAWPIMLKKTCFIAISLQLLSQTCSKLFPQHKYTILELFRAFKCIDSPNMEVIRLAYSVLPLPQPKSLARNQSWASMSAVTFFEICQSILKRFPVAHNWLIDFEYNQEGHVDIKLPSRTKVDKSSATNYNLRNKIAWGVPVWTEILNSEGVKTYLQLLKPFNPDVCFDKVIHFSGITPLPDDAVERHISGPRGKSFDHLLLATETCESSEDPCVATNEQTEDAESSEEQVVAEDENEDEDSLINDVIQQQNKRIRRR